MVKLVSPLNNTQVEKAKPKDKEYNLADGSGLFLRIKPNGSKLWLLNYYRPFTKVRTNLGLGSYPAVTLADARKKRLAIKALLADNIDPKAHQAEQLKNQQATLHNNLSQIAKNWMTIKSTQITPDYAEDIKRSLALHILPTLGRIPITQIRATQVIEVLKPIAARRQLGNN